MGRPQLRSMATSAPKVFMISSAVSASSVLSVAAAVASSAVAVPVCLFSRLSERLPSPFFFSCRNGPSLSPSSR